MSQNAGAGPQAAEQGLRDLVEGLGVIVWEADASTWQFSFVSQHAEDLLGYPVEQWLREPSFWVNHLHPEDRERAIAIRQTAPSLAGRDQDFEYHMVAADGRLVWLRDIFHVVRNGDGIAVKLRGLMVDTTERKQAEEQIRSLAVTDPLTGLANYRRLLEVLESEINRSQRTGRPFAVLLLDLDDLKKVNDNHGHLVGSRALCRLANVLLAHCRSIDTAARYGGDEFALVLPETAAEAAGQVARRISERLENDGEAPPLSASVGSAVYPQDGETIESLLGAADRALYASKRSGGGGLLVPK